MNRWIARCCIVVAAIVFCSVALAQTTFNYSITCTPTTLGPVTVDSAGFNVNSGTLILTPNVPLTGQSILSLGGSRLVNNNTVTSGTFTGTLPCSLTLGGVTVNYSQSLSMTIVPSGTTGAGCVFVGTAFACLNTGATSVTVNLGSQGTVVITAPSNITLGYDQNASIIIVPASGVDTALFTPAALVGTPLPPSILMTLTGLAAAGMFQARRKLRLRQFFDSK
ncbi:MAG: hypothetical protein M3O35_03725 [Acidobacteriota bacterium]|nr:hypothetical protein [Acidobacteriota bacterium]